MIAATLPGIFLNSGRRVCVFAFISLYQMHDELGKSEVTPKWSGT
jgi:hypothetical protein